MSVASVTEISAISPESFEAAINEGIARATSTLRGVQGAWIKDMNVVLEDGRIAGYQVRLAVTYVLEEPGESTPETATVTGVGREAGTTPNATTARDVPPRAGDSPPDVTRTGEGAWRPMRRPGSPTR